VCSASGDEWRNSIGGKGTISLHGCSAEKPHQNKQTNKQKVVLFRSSTKRHHRDYISSQKYNVSKSSIWRNDHVCVNANLFMKYAFIISINQTYLWFSLSRDIRQRMLVAVYRPFGDNLSVPPSRVKQAAWPCNLRHVASQTRAYFIYTHAEAWDQNIFVLFCWIHEAGQLRIICDSLTLKLEKFCSFETSKSSGRFGYGKLKSRIYHWMNVR
jgi:hypothetical protein